MDGVCPGHERPLEAHVHSTCGLPFENEKCSEGVEVEEKKRAKGPFRNLCHLTRLTAIGMVQIRSADKFV